MIRRKGGPSQLLSRAKRSGRSRAPPRSGLPAVAPAIAVPVAAAIAATVVIAVIVAIAVAGGGDLAAAFAQLAAIFAAAVGAAQFAAALALLLADFAVDCRSRSRSRDAIWALAAVAGMATAPATAARIRKRMMNTPFRVHSGHTGINGPRLRRCCMNPKLPPVHPRFRNRRKGAPLPGRPPRKPDDRLSGSAGLRPLLAAVAVDLAADRAARGCAEDRAEHARAAIVERIADQRADAGADDQAGGAVVAAAIIAAVAAAIDAVVRRSDAARDNSGRRDNNRRHNNRRRAGAGYNRSGCRSASRGCGPGAARARIRAAPGDIRGGCRHCAARDCIRAPRGARSGPARRRRRQGSSASRSPS